MLTLLLMKSCCVYPKQNYLHVFRSYVRFLYKLSAAFMLFCVNVTEEKSKMHFQCEFPLLVLMCHPPPLLTLLIAALC